MMRRCVAFLAFAAALTTAGAARAATISVQPAANAEPALVTVDGDLQPNDGATFRPLTVAEVECPKGRTFTWRITEIEAAGFDYFKTRTSMGGI
jgi:hypothetical protein